MRRTKLPPHWQVHTTRRRSRRRLTRADKRLGAAAVALMFVGVLSLAGRDRLPDWQAGLDAVPMPAYRNCAAARAAGDTPIRRGEPGYGPHLDRDNDGIGCEWG